MHHRPCVLVFAGLDPSGGAGIQADIEAIGALGAHALPIVTTLTVQDNNRVHAVHPVAAEILEAQAGALLNTIEISAVKLGIVGSRANAAVIARTLRSLRARQPALPVVLDPVMASGRGDGLSTDDALALLDELRPLATLITPNLPEATRLCGGETDWHAQARQLQALTPQVLIKGGHGEGNLIVNRWWGEHGEQQQWSWPRLDGEFHGSGCTLAAGIAALLAQGVAMPLAIERAQQMTQAALAGAYVIAEGQRIPARIQGHLTQDSQEIA